MQGNIKEKALLTDVKKQSIGKQVLVCNIFLLAVQFLQAE